MCVCILQYYLFLVMEQLNTSCPYQNLTAYLIPGQTKVKVKLLDDFFGVLAEGVHQFVKLYDSKECIYFVNIISKSISCALLCSNCSLV